MGMPHIETDYLVVGSGTAGLAFADALLTHSEAQITVVDRHGKPGGHWNDAYAFVTLHQPSAFYGVDSLELGSGRKDSVGLNQGLYELASGPEVAAYFDRVMNQRLLPSGRVRYFPLCDYLGDGTFESLLSGRRTRVTVRRRVVDATFMGPAVPATHRPGFSVAPGLRLVAPGALPGLWHGLGAGPRPRRFVVIGAGKTAMDTCIWLLQSGADADALTWIVPRDSWLTHRATTQTAPEFFLAAIGGQADQMEACARASSVQDLLLRLEAAGVLLRIDGQRLPGMFHYATVAPAEVEVLRRVRDVVRLGRVRALEAGQIVLEGGLRPVEPDTLFIDCTASAVRFKPPQPVFQDGRIVLQILRMPQPAFSAALAGFVEARPGDDAQKNRLCAPIPFPASLDDYPRALLANLQNQLQWGQDKAVRDWIRGSRLDGFGKLMASAARDDVQKQQLIARLKEHAPAAMANLARLAGAHAAAAPP